MTGRRSSEAKDIQRGRGRKRPRPLCMYLEAEELFITIHSLFVYYSLFVCYFKQYFSSRPRISGGPYSWEGRPPQNKNGDLLAREFWSVFQIFQRNINRAADSTMFQISKNAASSWSSFVCSLSVALFRDDF